MKRRVYLDWAAAAPVSPRARGVFLVALDVFGNPGSVHAEAKAAKAILEDARVRIARLAEVKADNVVFTSGATEANALAIVGAVRARGVSDAHVLYRPDQHASVIGAIGMLKEEGVAVEELTDIATQLRPTTVLVCMDAVNSETGECFDTLSVRRAIDAAKSKALLHVDASQAPLAQAFTLAHLGADMVSLDAQKVGGVRGIGALLLRQGITLAPLMRGGGQERGRRPGTEHPALATAFATALTEAEEGRTKFVENATRMRHKMITAISSIPRLEVNEGTCNVPHIVNVSLSGRDTDYLALYLDAKGFAVSTKSACESDSDEGSRAVRAMTNDTDRARSTLRISWGPTTKERELDGFADALVHAVRFLDENAIY
jgi:cysteine desulfurase